MKQFKGIFASIIVSMAILFLASEAIADDAAKARKAAQQANQYASQGEYKKALSPAFTFLKITKKNLGEDHIITSYGYQRLATLYLNLGEFDQAKNYLYLTKKHQSKHWGQKSLQLAPVYQLYGDFYALQNMPDKAIDHYKIAAYRYSKLGHKDGKIAQVTCLYYIAGVALAQSDFDDAYNYIQQAIKIIKAHIGSNSLEFAELTNMKAQVELVRENVNGALSSIKESIQILQKRNKTAEKLKLAEYYMGLASIHLVKGDTELAIEALKNIKDLTEDDAPASKRLRIKSLATLAVSYRQSDLARSGVMCLEEASALFKTLPPRQEEAFYEGFLQEMISACYVDLEDAEKAQYYLNSALEIYRDQLGPTNIGTIRTENALALILQKRNKHKEAIEIVERICHTLYEMPYDENFTYEHSYMLKASLYNHAISLENLQSHQEAYDKYKESLEYRDTQLSHTDPQLGYYRSLTILGKIRCILAEEKPDFSLALQNIYQISDLSFPGEYEWKDIRKAVRVIRNYLNVSIEWEEGSLFTKAKLLLQYHQRKGEAFESIQAYAEGYNLKEDFLDQSRKSDFRNH